MYLNQSELADEIRSMQTGNPMSDTLAQFLYTQANAVYNRGNYRIDKEDFRQMCLLGALRFIYQLRPDEAMAYIWTAFETTGIKASRREHTQLRIIAGYKLDPTRLEKKPISPVYVPKPKPPLLDQNINRNYVLDGKPVSVAQLAAIAGVSESTMGMRLRKCNRDVVAALAMAKFSGTCVLDGKPITIKRLAEMASVSRSTMRYRLIRCGYDASAALAYRSHNNPVEPI